MLQIVLRCDPIDGLGSELLSYRPQKSDVVCCSSHPHAAGGLTILGRERMDVVFDLGLSGPFRPGQRDDVEASPVIQ